MRPADKSKCIHVLLSLVELKERTQWPLGIIYVCSREGSVEVLYLGVPSAKLVLLVRQMPQSEVNVWVAGASAYVTGMNTTASVRMLRPFVAQQMSHLVGTGDVSVEMQSGCSRISLLGHQCTTYHCPFCILVQIGLSVYSLPRHPGIPFDSQECLHLFGEASTSGQGVTVTGHLGRFCGRVSLVLFHVTHGLGDLNSVQGFSEWKHYAQLDWVLPLLPNANPELGQSRALSTPFISHGLPNCYYEDFFVLPCDRNSRICALLDEWGFCVRDDG